jgi:hypothetical protein
MNMDEDCESTLLHSQIIDPDVTLFSIIEPSFKIKGILEGEDRWPIQSRS